MTDCKNMSKKSLRKYLPLIKLLTEKQIPRKSFECLIQNLDAKAIKFICECVQNAISVKHISNLKGKKKTSFLNEILLNKKSLKLLCEKHKNYKRHRKIISQKGHGFILPVLSAIISLITSLLAR